MYNLEQDPTEHTNIAAQHTDIRDLLFKKIQAHNATTFTPNRGHIDTNGTCRAVRENGGFWGPWIE